MRKIITAILLTGIMLFAAWAAGTETGPVTMEEIESFALQIRETVISLKALNDPAADEAQSEDGIEMQFGFGLVYADRVEMTPETEISAIQIMDQDTPGPRGIAVDWEVSRVMEAIPCGNPDMRGTRERALLYLEGDAEKGYRYGLVERDGQRIQAMEYGEARPAEGRRLALTLQISGDGELTEFE